MTLALAPDDIPYLPRGVRLHEDRARGQMVLLAPEKAVALDDIGVAILNRVTGNTKFADIIADLVATFGASEEQITTDVQRFLGGLRGRMYLMVRS